MLNNIILLLCAFVLRSAELSNEEQPFEEGRITPPLESFVFFTTMDSQERFPDFVFEEIKVERVMHSFVFEKKSTAFCEQVKTHKHLTALEEEYLSDLWKTLPPQMAQCCLQMERFQSLDLLQKFCGLVHPSLIDDLKEMQQRFRKLDAERHRNSRKELGAAASYAVKSVKRYEVLQRLLQERLKSQTDPAVLQAALCVEWGSIVNMRWQESGRQNDCMRKRMAKSSKQEHSGSDMRSR